MKAVDWLARHGARLADTPYERMFVEEVLTRIPDFDFRTLDAQYRFEDDRQKTRYCDFVIREGKGVRIAIEVDGYDKRGTGAGMTRAEFLDWQRRHASLVAQGWRVLRFANTDVKHHPGRCAGVIELLLRDERSKDSHAYQLEQRIKELEAAQLRKVAEERASYGPVVDSHAGELEQLRSELGKARQAVKLTDQERGELETSQRLARILEKETNIMKTTIWALTALMALLLILFFQGRSPSGDTATVQRSLPEPAVQPATTWEPASQEPAGRSPQAAFERPQVPTAVQANPTPAPAPVSLAGGSCADPLPWNSVGEYIGMAVAIAGPVARVSTRDDVRGKPVFITLGRPFPSRQRIDLVIWEGQRGEFLDLLEQDLEGRDVCVFSEVGERDGIPQMVLRHGRDLQLR